VSVVVTNMLIGLRQALDPSFVPLNQAQDVLATSAAYGAYMATSSNIRCVFVCGWRHYWGDTVCVGGGSEQLCGWVGGGAKVLVGECVRAECRMCC